MKKTKMTNEEWIEINFPAIMNGTATPATLGWATRKLRNNTDAKAAARNLFFSSSLTEEQKFKNSFPNLAKLIGV